MSKKRRRGQQDEGEGRVAKKQLQDQNLPVGVRRYETLQDVDWDTQSYFRQRYKLFSRYDEGILMTDDSWFGVTQESIANKIAEHVAEGTPPERKVLIDAFCGVGGNTIAFALSGRWSRVYAIEKDLPTLECARRNAEIYGVHDKITFFHGDCFEILGAKGSDHPNSVPGLGEMIQGYGVLFASPPWGGPGYKSADVFDLSKMEPYSLDALHQGLGSVAGNMVLYFPRTSDLRQLARVVEDGKKASVVHYCTDGGSRALCIFLGNWLKFL